MNQQEYQRLPAEILFQLEIEMVLPMGNEIGRAHV